MDFDFIRTPINKYTFKSKKIKKWVEDQCIGKVLNLFCGEVVLDLNEVRNDIDINMIADYYMEALKFVEFWQDTNKDKFDTILLDPPYSYRKSMEFYNGYKNSKFKLIKDIIPHILNKDGKVITFGYHSVSMGKKRGFKLTRIAIFSHGGAIHDTIASVEVLE